MSPYHSLGLRRWKGQGGGRVAVHVPRSQLLDSLGDLETEQDEVVGGKLFMQSKSDHFPACNGAECPRVSLIIPSGKCLTAERSLQRGDLAPRDRQARGDGCTVTARGRELLEGY